MFVFANYYCYDIPSSLEIMIEQEFRTTESAFGLIYTLYGVPNTVIPLLGGALLDKIGSRITLVIFTSLVVVG